MRAHKVSAGGVRLAALLHKSRHRPAFETENRRHLPVALTQLQTTLTTTAELAEFHSYGNLGVSSSCCSNSVPDIRRIRDRYQARRVTAGGVPLARIAGKRPATVPANRPIIGASSTLPGLIVVVQPRLALVATTPRMPMLAPATPATNPTRPASTVIWRRICARLAPSARRKPISSRRSMTFNSVALAIATPLLQGHSSLPGCGVSRQPHSPGHKRIVGQGPTDSFGSQHRGG